MAFDRRKLDGQLENNFSRWIRRRINGRVTSNRTQGARREVVWMALELLYDLGFKIERIENLGARHIEALVRHWWEKGRSPKTITNYLCVLRQFADSLGKPGLVQDLQNYLPDVDPVLLKVTVAARASKGWSAQGIQPAEIITAAEAVDWRFGLMLEMQLRFGLRRKEAILMRPWQSDLGSILMVYPGQGKNGRPRAIPITAAEQRATLERVKEKIGKTDRLGWPIINGHDATFMQQVNRYKNLMAACGITKQTMGVTGHGLRAQFAENEEISNGIVPATLGGRAQQLSRDDLILRRRQVSEALGHSRPNIITAYSGSFRQKKASEPLPVRTLIERAVEILCRRNAVLPVEDHLEQDCNAICAELGKYEINIVDAPVAQALWRVYSGRFAVEWIRPTKGIWQGIAAAAWTVVAQNRGGVPIAVKK